jgi:POT family proton-dependent oligopeptide transporter
MWERFSFYGMRALLLFYMAKSFLKYPDSETYAVYGAYTALVYMSPFFGGILADRLLGPRRAVILGGLLMAAGQSLLAVPNTLAFFTSLALLICGNGFFKPNISTIVGSLYAPGSPKRDGGFTIFYMGINLGAAMSPLLCGYIGETYDYRLGFGLAAIGMLIGIAVFVARSWAAQITIICATVACAVSSAAAPAWVALQAHAGNVALALQQHVEEYGRLYLLVGLCLLAAAVAMAVFRALIPNILVAGGALAGTAAMLVFRPENPFSMAINIFVVLSLLTAAAVAWVALVRGGLRADAGAPPEHRRTGPARKFPTEWLVYLAVPAAIMLFVLLVSGFSVVRQAKRGITVVPPSVIENLEARHSAAAGVAAVVLRESGRPAGLVVMLSGLVAGAYLAFETFRLDRIARQRMYVVLILMFFSMIFFAFFEQAGSSLNNFTDRNVDRVIPQRTVTPAEVGRTIRLQPTQEQLGYHNGPDLFTLDMLGELREEHGKDTQFTIDWKLTGDDVGMGIADRTREIPASTFLSVNSVFILIFGLLFTALWGFLANRGLEPSTTVKFALGLLQLGLGFVAFWLGAQMADSRGMVAAGWLLLGYLLHTTGELCLSPVGLSMVTRLSPARLVSTVMGVWFLATAFSQLLAAIIAQFTSVKEAAGRIPVPAQTVHLYGDVYGKIAVASVISALICFALAPILTRWMHPEIEHREEPEASEPLA